MKGDFSRLTFAERKHYRRVLMQQGRVDVDADGNEQIAIDDHIATATSYDVIGRTGYPLALLPDGTPAGGFEIGLDPSNKDLTISAGRMYVEGHLIENDDPSATLLAQPDLPAATLADVAAGPLGLFVVYVDVWERLITALDDPSLRETALGGPDTSARSKLVWQVRLAPVATSAGVIPTCASLDDSWRPSSERGTLAASAGAPTVDPLPCILPPETGYRRLENQLYRVEIHQPGGYGAATFKWSRENGSMVAGVVCAPGANPASPVAGPTFQLTGLGRDDSLAFHAGDWVELSDDHTELVDGAGELLHVKAVSPDGSITTTAAAGAPVSLALHPKLRRWDQPGDPALGGEVPIPDGGWIALEGGVQVQFSDGPFAVGDYWLIPARTKTSLKQGGVEWPLDAANVPVPLAPRGVRHHYAKLALVTFSDGEFLAPAGDTLPDCRLPFLPLTEIHPAEPSVGPCTLVAVPGPGWEKPIGDYFATAEQPVDAEICFPVGLFPLESPLVIASSGNVKLSGAGWGTKLVATGAESAIRFEGCRSVAVRDLAAETGTVTGARTEAGRDHIKGTLTFADCDEVLVENVFLRCGSSATLRGASCLTASSEQTEANASTGAGTARIRGCRLWVGEMQVGVLLVHLARATVEDNEITVDPQAPSTFLSQRLKDPHYLAGARSFLISQTDMKPPRPADRRVRAEATPAQPALPAAEPAPPVEVDRAAVADNVASASGTPKSLVNVNVGNQELSFMSHPGLQSTWQTYLTRSAPSAFATKRDALKFVKAQASQILTDPATRKQFSSFAGIYRLLNEAHVPVAARGIVVGGRTVGDLHISGNRIAGVFQGIAAGVSHQATAAERTAEQRTHDGMRTVRIRANTIVVQLNEMAARQGRYGVFVGNVNSLEVEGNRIALVPAVGIPQPPISDGIRVWGYLGKRMIVRGNHVTRFPLAIRVVAQTGPGKYITDSSASYVEPISRGPLWLVADNAVEFTGHVPQPIDAPACLLVNNRS